MSWQVDAPLTEFDVAMRVECLKLAVSLSPPHGSDEEILVTARDFAAFAFGRAIPSFADSPEDAEDDL
jgi:hypothetical protein